MIWAGSRPAGRHENEADLRGVHGLERQRGPHRPHCFRDLFRCPRAFCCREWPLRRRAGRWGVLGGTVVGRFRSTRARHIVEERKNAMSALADVCRRRRQKHTWPPHDSQREAKSSNPNPRACAKSATPTSTATSPRGVPGSFRSASFQNCGGRPHHDQHRWLPVVRARPAPQCGPGCCRPRCPSEPAAPPSAAQRCGPSHARAQPPESREVGSGRPEKRQSTRRQERGGRWLLHRREEIGAGPRPLHRW